MAGYSCMEFSFSEDSMDFTEDLQLEVLYAASYLAGLDGRAVYMERDSICSTDRPFCEKTYYAMASQGCRPTILVDRAFDTAKRRPDNLFIIRTDDEVVDTSFLQGIQAEIERPQSQPRAPL